MAHEHRENSLFGKFQVETYLPASRSWAAWREELLSGGWQRHLPVSCLDAVKTPGRCQVFAVISLIVSSNDTFLTIVVLIGSV